MAGLTNGDEDASSPCLRREYLKYKVCRLIISDDRDEHSMLFLGRLRVVVVRIMRAGKREGEGQGGKGKVEERRVCRLPCSLSLSLSTRVAGSALDGR